MRSVHFCDVSSNQRSHDVVETAIASHTGASMTLNAAALVRSTSRFFASSRLASRETRRSRRCASEGTGAGAGASGIVAALVSAAASGAASAGGASAAGSVDDGASGAGAGGGGRATTTGFGSRCIASASSSSGNTARMTPTSAHKRHASAA